MTELCWFWFGVFKAILRSVTNKDNRYYSIY